MLTRPAKTCPCGSGHYRSELYDARGIFCTFFCSDCEEEKRARYRPEVLSDPAYWADEDFDD